MDRNQARAVVVAVFALVSPATAAFASGPYVPGSGDVDRDGRLTGRDAMLIVDSIGWIERDGLRAFLLACDFNHDGRCDGFDADAILKAAVTNPSDYDGDGVANASDCAPLDDRLARPHVFFWDLDRDHYGNSANQASLCVMAPPNGMVAWGGDPNDTTAFALPLIVPKGDRHLGLDFSDLASDKQWRPDLAHELGADVATLSIAWSSVETAPGVFAPAPHALDIANIGYPAQGFSVSLTLNPVYGSLLTVPADLRAAIESGTLRFSDPLVINRFRALLSHLHDRLPKVRLSSLQIGYEVDRFLALTPAYFWDDYRVFFEAAAAHARQLWGADLKVGITATHSALVAEATRARFSTLLSSANIVSFTYRPHTGFQAPDPSTVRRDIEEVLARYYPKPLYVEDVAFPSAPAAGSSETRQSQLYRAFFEVWDTWAAHIPFAGLQRLQDYSPQRAEYEALTVGGGAAAAAYLRSLGLRTYDGSGSAKSAYHTVRDLTFNRGWWRRPATPARTYALGFTPALYDFPDDPAEFIAMQTWIEDKLTTDAEIVNLHLDHGVPWVEALADDFSSPALPYANSLKTMWTSMRARVPTGKKTLVSLNPLGVPRNVIAPYFGVGEGFVYDDQFRRVGDGIVKDAENRLPPAPWNTYPLNHPDVKRAFLNYCRRAVDFFHPDYLMVSIEVTAVMTESPGDFGRFLDLQRFIYEQMKADPVRGQVPIVVSLSGTSFMTDEFGVPMKFEEQEQRRQLLQIQGLMDVAPYMDLLALSLYPHYGMFSATTIPAYMFEPLFDALKLVGKPIAVSESGFPAEPFEVLQVPFMGDEVKQARFYDLLFSELDRSPVPVAFAVSYELRDGDRGWARLVQGSQQNPPTVSPHFVEFYKYFRDIGLYDGEGGERPSLALWKDELAKPRVAPQP